MPWTVEAARGEGRIGLEGLLSELNVLNIERLSGNGGALPRLAKVVPPALPLCRLIAIIPQLEICSELRKDLVTVGGKESGHLGACLCPRV